MEEEEEMDNYFDLGPSATGKWKHYVYLDMEEPLIVSLLARHQVHVKCEAVMHKDNEKYTMIALKVLKKDAGRESTLTMAAASIFSDSLAETHPEIRSPAAEIRIWLTLTQTMKTARERNTGMLPDWTTSLYRR